MFNNNEGYTINGGASNSTSGSQVNASNTTTNHISGSINQYSGDKNVHNGDLTQIHINYSDGSQLATRVCLPSPSRHLEESITSSERYTSLMLTAKQGHPLWYPQPNESLPESYVQEGVRIGDVGIIHKDRPFDFLFNITVPANHPINSRGVPQGFIPVVQDLEQLDITKLWEHRVHGAQIQGPQYAWSKYRDPGSNSMRGNQPCLRFTSSKERAALLTLPNGSSCTDLNSKGVFLEYAITHSKRWFAYAKKNRGRLDPSLYLVTSSEKCSSWGITSFYNPNHPSDISLSLRMSSTVNQRTVYSWDDHDFCDSKAYPSGTSASNSSGDAPQNQTIFIRGFRVSKRKWMAPEIQDDTTAETSQGSNRGTSNRQRLPLGSLFNSSVSGLSTSNVAGGSTVRNAEELEVEEEPSSETPHHPGDIINDFLRTIAHAVKRDNAEYIAISHDDDWTGSSTEKLCALLDSLNVLDFLKEVTRDIDVGICRNSVYTLRPGVLDNRLLDSFKIIWDGNLHPTFCRVSSPDVDLESGLTGRGVAMDSKSAKGSQGHHLRSYVDAKPGSLEESESEASAGAGAPSIFDRSDADIDLTRGRKRDMTAGDHSNSSGTNSSEIANYFPKRYFILKSLSQFDFDLSVSKGLWATQKHIEGVLDEAYKTSAEVFLIFSANKRREFYGWGKMAGPVKHGPLISWPQRSTFKPNFSASASNLGNPLLSASAPPAIYRVPVQTDMIYEEMPASPTTVLQRLQLGSGSEPKYFTNRMVEDSPQPVTRLSPLHGATPGAGVLRHSFGSSTVEGGIEARETEGSTSSPPEVGDNKIPAKTFNDFELDTEAPLKAVRYSSPFKPSPASKRKAKATRNDPSTLGESFKVEWLCVHPLPFNRTKHLRNPWNHDREVKVCRDGTELEPGVGEQLLEEWKRFIDESKPIEE